jgi:hypothetical protein
VEELMIEDDGRGRNGYHDHDCDRDCDAGDDTYSSFTRNSVPENSSSGKLYDDDDDNSFRGTLGALFSIQVQHTRTKHKEQQRTHTHTRTHTQTHTHTHTHTWT